MPGSLRFASRSYPWVSSLSNFCSISFSGSGNIGHMLLFLYMLCFSFLYLPFSATNISTNSVAWVCDFSSEDPAGSAEHSRWAASCCKVFELLLLSFPRFLVPASLKLTLKNTLNLGQMLRLRRQRTIEQQGRHLKLVAGVLGTKAMEALG